MTEGAPGLSASLGALHSLGVERAETWFDEDGFPVEFAVVFHGTPREQTIELQDGLKDLARSALVQAVGPNRPEFAYGRLSADTVGRSVSLEFMRTVDETNDDRAVIDLTSPASLFERSVVPEDDVADDPGPWDLRWEMEDEIEVGTWIAGEHTSEPEDADVAAPAEVGEGEADHADRVREHEMMAALDEALTALREVGAVKATVRYSVKDFVRDFSDALNAVAAAYEPEKQAPDELVASIGETLAELAIDEGALRFESIELDGRGLAETEPMVPWLQAVALLVVPARFGEPGELWAMSGGRGVLELDLERLTARIAYRRLTRRVDVEHVVLQAGDHA